MLKSVDDKPGVDVLESLVTVHPVVVLKVTDVRFLHDEKAHPSIVVTLEGIIIDVRLSQA